MAVTGRAPRRQRSRGVAALELALSLTFLVPLLMGTLDFGYYFYIGTNAEEAARAGVREAVLASGGAACGAPASSVKTNGEARHRSGTGTACSGGAAYCYMNEPPLSMGGDGRQHHRHAHLLGRAGQSDLDHHRPGRLLARDHVLQVDDAGQHAPATAGKVRYTATLTSD